MPGVGGITVGEKIHAAVASFFDDANVFRSLTLYGYSAELDVRVIYWNVGLLGDFDFFHQSVESFVGFVTDVRAVEAAVFGGAAGHGDEFGGVVVASHFLFITPAKAHCPFVLSF